MLPPSDDPTRTDDPVTPRPDAIEVPAEVALAAPPAAAPSTEDADEAERAMGAEDVGDAERAMGAQDAEVAVVLAPPAVDPLDADDADLGPATLRDITLPDADVPHMPLGDDRADGAELPEPAEPSDEGEAGPVADTAPPAPVPTTVADLVAATLRAAGVRLAFTVPGESFLPLLESLERAGIRLVTTRHEGTAAFAAEAYGQLTGRPAACLGTRAVGAANLAIGVHTAQADSTPMFVLVGQVERGFRGREAFQEVDLVETFGRLGRYAVEIDDPATAAETLGEAVRHALGGRPGPVLLSLPEDVMDGALPSGTQVPVIRPQPARPELDDVRAVLHALAGAERPVILAGGGVLRARCSNDLAKLAELLEVPVIASWRRGDVISNDHPLYLGMAGYGSPAPVLERLRTADLIVVLGSRLNEITSFGYRIPAPGQRWIHVDVAPVAAPWLPAPERTVTADAKAFIRAALTRLRDAVLLAAPLEQRRRHNPSDRRSWEAATIVDAERWSGPGVHPGRIVAAMRRILPDDAIITTDAGNFGGWVARGFRFRRPGTFLGPTSGAMGYGLPAALAAAVVHRDRPVVAVVGDGGLGMTLADLETAVREHARMIVVVFDNERYGTIRMHQERRGTGLTPATDLGPLDFAAVARACGARGIRIDTDEAFDGAFRAALAADRPTVLHLVLDRRWLSVDEPATRPTAGSPTAG